jgi:hypothetical protein
VDFHVTDRGRFGLGVLRPGVGEIGALGPLLPCDRIDPDIGVGEIALEPRRVLGEVRLRPLLFQRLDLLLAAADRPSLLGGNDDVANL